jgi:hypothetical protein
MDNPTNDAAREEPGPQPAPVPPPQLVEREQVIDEPVWAGGVSPLELIDTEANDPLIRIVRTKALGPKKGYDDGSEGTGPCGMVEHDHGFEQEVLTRWGGGTYKATSTVNGKPMSKVFVLDGVASKPLLEESEEDYGPSVYGTGYGQTAQVYGQQQQQAGYGQTASPYERTATPYERTYRDPYAQSDPYARTPQGGYPQGGRYGGGGGVAGVYRNASHVQAQSSEAAALRVELDALKERNAEQAKNLEVERVRAAAERKDAEAKRALDQLQAQIVGLKDAVSAPQGKNDHIEILKAQIEMDRERHNRQQAEAAKRWQQELELRRERQKREDDKRREDEKRYERERQERIDREKREMDMRREERKEERERADRDRARQDAANDRMFKVMFQQKSDPFADLLKLKKLDGGSPLQKIKEVTGVMAELKSLAGADGAEPTKLDQASQFINGVSEAVTPIIGEVAKYWGPAPAEPNVEHVESYQQQQQYQPQQLTYAQQHEQQVYEQQQQEQQQHEQEQQQEQEQQGPRSLQSEVTPAQWAKILDLAVDSFTGGSPPVTTARHMLTCLKFDRCLEALPELANASTTTLKLKVNILRMSRRVTDPYYAEKVGRFAEILQTETGCAWVDQLLEEFRRLNSLLAQHRAQQEAQQEAGQQATEQSADTELPAPKLAPQPGPPPVVQPDAATGEFDIEGGGAPPAESF